LTPDISEFSYGFALTQELIAIADPPLRAAPIFPSLIEEGRPGGGYDVRLDIPGFPLFVQFKRADCMVRRSASETVPPYSFRLPFYRMKITARTRSAQHDMLIDLDTGRNQVFYAAPLFHTVEELNRFYLQKTVSMNSFFIRPRSIGRLDDDSHHVAFDAGRYWVFSEPHEVSGISGEQFPHALRARLAEDRRPLRDGPLQDILRHIERIVGDRHLPVPVEEAETAARDDSFRVLRRLADFSFRYFSAQLFVVQAAERRGELRGPARA
jgi:hypothetical protein